MTLVLFIEVAALVLAAAEVIKSNGKSMIAWAVLLLAIALTFPTLRAL